MEIVVYQAEGRVPVTVMQPNDRIDGSNYTEVILAARTAYEAGARDFVLDLSQVPYSSSSGVVAIHTIALMSQTGELPNEESGWESLRSIDRALGKGFQPHLKIASPQPPVARVLDLTGMNQFIEVFSDVQTAVRAF